LTPEQIKAIDAKIQQGLADSRRKGHTGMNLSEARGMKQTLERVNEMRTHAPDYVERCPEGMKPNPAFSPVINNGKVRFADAQGNLHEHASEAAAANVAREQNTFTVTGGNCPQVPETVPDFVPK
jgi:hypothetical protein